MRNRLLLIFVLIFSALLLLAGHTHVAALGASDNATVPGGPAGEQPQNEIKPPVDYALLGPSSQPQDTPPGIVASFVGISGQEKLTVNGDENWYLDLDINRPGWIYLYEYFPAGQPSPGQWLAYKFQLPESGLWRLGPFTPAYDEGEGQHVYRLWFYSNGQWAAGSSDAAPPNLIYWTYTKALPSETVTTPPTPAEAGLASKVYELFTRPLVLVACLLAMVAALAVLVIYLWRRRNRDISSLSGKLSLSGTAEPLPTVPATAKLILPNGADINIYDDPKVIGRSELARALGLDDLAIISRRHFEVKSDDTRFYVEDLGSANGTRLNNRDISGKGPVKLNDGDVIKPAGAVSLEFHIF